MSQAATPVRFLLLAGLTGVVTGGVAAQHHTRVGQLHLSDNDGHGYRVSSTLEAEVRFGIGTYAMQTLFDSDPCTG